jgi:phage/plasmid-like protein (TIGR03299 family)
MSAETLEWLNANVMYGFAHHRTNWGAGTSFSNGQRPWFADSNYKFLYPDAIPVEDVINNLFHWEPVEQIPHFAIPCDMATADGIDTSGHPFRWVTDTRRKAIMRPDTNEVFGYFGASSYKVHSYGEWLIDNVATMLDAGEIGISSAGLLRGGGQAWVSIELPDDIEVEGAGHIRPCIIAATSLDGSLATTYATRIMRPECDNSLRLSLAASGGTLRVKHSSRSLTRINDARQALGIVYQIGEQATEWFDMLASVDITDQQFNEIVRTLAPVPNPDVVDGKVKNQRAITIATNKQVELHDLWAHDHRAAPWNGTLAGAYHAVSTWQQHMLPQDDVQIRRLMVGTVTGTYDKAEQEFWQIVDSLDIKLPELVVA